MTFYRQREAKNRMRKKTDSEAVSEDAANTLIEIASKTFGDLICRFDGNRAFISAGANDTRDRGSFEIISEQRDAFIMALEGTGWKAGQGFVSGPRGGRSCLDIRAEYSADAE